MEAGKMAWRWAAGGVYSHQCETRKDIMALCARCNGKGLIPCPQCGGRGVRDNAQLDLPGSAVRDDERCPACAGTGSVVCPACDGSGEVDDEDD